MVLENCEVVTAWASGLFSDLFAMTPAHNRIWFLPKCDDTKGYPE